MKNIKLFFLFLKDLFGWYGDGAGMKELWCKHFGHDINSYNFSNVCIYDEIIHKYESNASLDICKRCAKPIGTLYT